MRATIEQNARMLMQNRAHMTALRGRGEGDDLQCEEAYVPSAATIEAQAR